MSVRSALTDFPDVVIHETEEVRVKKHPDYLAAKAGDLNAARRLVESCFSADALDRIFEIVRQTPPENRPVLVPVHALETTGVNRIPVALADKIEEELGLTVETSIVQTNTVGHTGADGFHRMAHQARFDGHVDAGFTYFLIDDFVGQGGTLANLIGFIRSKQGVVLGATVLTGKAHSAGLSQTHEQAEQIRQKHGAALEEWWRRQFGFGFAELTRSEARYLLHSEDAGLIRNRLAAAGLAGNGPGASP